MSLRHVSIGTRLGLAFGVLLLLLGLVGGIGALQIGRVQFNANDLGTNWLPSIDALSTLRATANEVRRTSLRHVLEDSKEKKLAQEEILKRDIDTVLPKQLAAYEKLIASEEERQMFNTIRERWNAFTAIDKKLIQLSYGGVEHAAEARQLAAGPAAEAFTAAMDAIARNNELNVAGGRKATAQAECDYHTALYMQGGMIALNHELKRLFPAIQTPIVYAQQRLPTLQKLRLHDYRKIASAVKAGDDDAADAAGSEHVRNVRQEILKRAQ